jgi:hypothetical protein
MSNDADTFGQPSQDTSAHLALTVTSAAQEAVEADGRASWRGSAPSSCRYLTPLHFLMRPLLDGGTLDKP